MRKSIIIAAVGFAGIMQTAVAQNNNSFQQQYDSFKNNATKEYIDFRRNANKEYAEFMRNAWKKYGAEPPVKKPIEKKVTIVPFPEEDFNKPIDSKPIVINNVIQKLEPIKQPVPPTVIPEIPYTVPYIDKGIRRPKDEIDFHLDSIKSLLAIITPQDIPLDTLDHLDLIDVLPQLDQSIMGMRNDFTQLKLDTIKGMLLSITPQDIPQDTLDHMDLIDLLPYIEDNLDKKDKNFKLKKQGIKSLEALLVPQVIPNDPIEIEDDYQYMKFNFYGTEMKVRLCDDQRFKLVNCKESTIADTWLLLSDERYNNLIRDCLMMRVQYNLCDWAYLQMIKTISDQFFGTGTNEAAMLTAYLYCQSGYKMRLGTANNKLFMLYGTKNRIYDKLYYILDGEFYYPLDCNEESMHICNVKYPKEQELSLLVMNEQKFNMEKAEERTIASKRYPGIKVTTNANKNLIEFYDKYPSSEVNNDFMTRWAMYANTPMSEQVKNDIYPVLKKNIEGKSQLDAVNMILNFVQTGLVYEYDDKVWGGDRAFFAEESLYYPFCDCEDRSVLFSRLVRDLLGMKVILVYYPGHLATAVHFDSEVKGDYITLNGENYTVCDPTYINAGVGRTMPRMDNSKTTVMLLE